LSRFETAHLDAIPRAGPHWIPVRRHFGIQAFGTNAWTGDEGESVVGEHDEVATGHEELYVVVRGRATFTVAGDELEAPEGTIVFVRDPGVKRGAVAREAGTTIFTAGAKPGEAFQVSPWELWADVQPLYAAKEYDAAIEVLEQGREHHGDAPGLLYNLACCESLAGRRDAALEHLGRSIELDETFRALARDDADFDAIRDEPEFGRLTT
jgi:tetratricopeptide (TPR) repeat protein